MRIDNHGTTLVVRESRTFLRAAFGITAVATIAIVVVAARDSGVTTGLLVKGFLVELLLVPAFLLLQDLRFIFDPAARVVHWQQRRLLSSRSGTIAFDDIRDVAIRAELDLDKPNASATRWRLALVTSTGDVFLTNELAAGKEKLERSRSVILTTLTGPADEPAPARRSS